MTDAPDTPRRSFRWPSLDNIEQLAKIFSIFLVPVIVAIIGGVIQRTIEQNKTAIEDRKIALEYVKLAKEILARDQKEIGELPDALTSWAWQLISDVSPTKIPPASLAQLQEKKTPLPIDLGAAPSLEDYRTMFETAVLTDRGRARALADADRVVAGKDRYVAVENMTGVPWFVIGILHGLEGGFNFSTHLHNGDPLTQRTVHVPAGRPTTGSPPFSWEDSAADALRMQRWDTLQSWSVPDILLRFERYNGLGYRRRGVASPYIWSCTNHYASGKFVADLQFQPNVVAVQCGAAALLKALAAKNVVALKE